MTLSQRRSELVITMNDVNIRKLEISDYEKIYSLWLSCRGMGLNETDDSREGIAKFLERNPDTCFAAEFDSKIIGVILCGNDGRRGYIYHLAVSEEYRHRGIASALVNEAVFALERLGIKKAALVVFSRNESGNAFWEKTGFTERTDLTYRNKAFAELVRVDT